MNEIARGLLLVAAMAAGTADAQPAPGHDSAAVAQAPVAALKREYLRCDRVASQQRLATEAALYCSAVSEELLKREFEGDLERLLAWWREARLASVSQ